MEIPRFDSIRSYVIEKNDVKTGIRFILKQHPRDILKTDLQKKEVYIDDVKYDVERVIIQELLGLRGTEVHIYTKL